MYAIDLSDIKTAAGRIQSTAHVTPVHTCGTLDALSGRQLFFKCEIFQKGGAFKFRGACNAVAALPSEAAAAGVVTHSSGNHAAALALAARLRGIPAYIVVPSNAPRCKVDAVREYGGQVMLCAPTMEAREAMCAEVQARTGATLIPPYNYGPVMAGQGTIGLEFMQQVAGLDAVVVPVSGGGMIAGVALAVKRLSPSVKVIAAEPCGANNAADVAACKAAGHLLPTFPRPYTIADGLQARLGDLTWPVVRDMVDAVVVVSEADLLGAMKLIMERMKLVVEPSGAAGLAAVLSPAFQSDPTLAACQRVGVVLCGGNLDFGAKGFWDPSNWLPAE